MLWFLSYVMKKKPPQREYQSLGSQIHKALEDFINDGLYPDLADKAGQLASKALHLIPLERAVQSEVRFDQLPIQPESPIPMAGIIDLLCLDGDVPLCLDFKTTKSKRWVKRKSDLVTDIQLMIYARFALANAPHAESIDIGLVYISSSLETPFTHLVQTRVSRVDVDAFWEKEIEPSMDEIALASVSYANEMNRSYDFCSAYGGCQLIDICEAQGTPQV